MLQWNGGSRRQVYASRKSTQSRQRQYFEQKKRQQQQQQQQQGSGVENQDDTDGAGGQAYGDQAHRSLDVISLNNLAASASHRNSSGNADSAVPHVDRAPFNASPMEALKKVTSAYNTNPKETSSHPRLSSPVGYQDVTAAVNPHEGPPGCKISPSNNYGAKKRYQNVDPYSGDISLIDLVKYEGPRSLGHVKMETSPHSPRSTKRICPLPPKAMRYTQNKARRSMPFDATKGLGSLMNGISMMKERIASHKMGSNVDESSYERRKHCYFSHSFENYTDDHYPEDEDMFCKPEAQEGWQSKLGRTDVVNSNRPWKIDSFNSDDHFLTPRVDEFDTFDYGLKEQRTSTRPSTRFQTSEPSVHDIFSDQSLLDEDDDMLHFDWDRQPPFKKTPNSNSNFGPYASSSEMVDDSEKRKSLLSEESCSFAGVFRDQEEYHKRTTDKKILESDYWPDKAMDQQKTREPSPEENFAGWGSSTSHLNGSCGRNNPSSCTAMREDKPFDSIPDMGEHQTVGSTERRPASKVHPVFHRPDSAVLDDDIHLQNPVSDIFGDKIEFSDPFGGMGLRGDIDMCTFLGRH